MVTNPKKSPKLVVMVDSYPHVARRAAVLLLLIVVAACAAPRVPPAPISKADRDELIEVFLAGYRNISERYIEPVSVKSLALNGIDGLSSIDPALKSRVDGGVVILDYSGDRIKTLLAPSTDDLIGWTRATAVMVEAARHVSPDMAVASKEKVYEAVFDGVLSGLDLFSRYAGADEAKKNRARRDGYGGIGIKFRVRNNRLVITATLPGTPASNAALSVGDIITEIDDKPVTGRGKREIVSMLRGPTQSTVALSISRAGRAAPIRLTLTRAHIVPVTVTEKRESGILYFSISSFNQDTSHSLSKKLTRARKEMGKRLKGIVLDLRGNPGGLLKQSVKVADLLLTHGDIVSTRGRHLDSLHKYQAVGHDLAAGIPIVVFIDGKSASAAEIVAAALQDRNRAVLIGTSSYGKGTVQTVIRLPNDGEITLTWSRFLAPSGYPLHGLGVRPTICTSSTARSALSLVQKTLNTEAELKATFASWRRPTLQTESTRRALRKTCPPERHKANLEMAVARQIFDIPTLYTKTLDLPAGMSQARQ